MAIFNAQGEPAFGYRIWTSLLLFGLLAEWMLPWSEAGSRYYIDVAQPLILFVGCIAIAGLLRAPWYIMLVVYAVIGITSMMRLYKGPDVGPLEWASGFASRFAEEVGGLFGMGAAWGMSTELQALLLFTGFALLVPALQALIWLRQLGLALAGITAGYLILLHAWLGMDVLNALLRVTVEGMLLGAIVMFARMRRLQGEESREEAQTATYRWSTSAFVVVGLCLGAGLLLSGGKSAANSPAAWTEPLTARLEQYVLGLEHGNPKAALASADASGSYASTGYGFDDSTLGAPLKQDERIVFTGLSPVRTYWRGETKAFYTGKGWQETEQRLTLLPIQNGGERIVSVNGEGSVKEESEAVEAIAEAAIEVEADTALKTETETDADIKIGTVKGAEAGEGRDIKSQGTGAETAVSPERVVVQTVLLKQAERGLPLFMGGTSGTLLDITSSEPKSKLNTYLKNEASGTLYAPSDKVLIDRYTVQTLLPVMDEAALRSGGMQAGEKEALAEYLQLPESLPSRVAALAAEVAGGGLTSRYDQVKAVETYLRSSYTYSAENSTLPKGGADFVDDFLFKQHEGYCVHFSSAMVIMLRTQGIPARWVKGFAPGTVSSEQPDTRKDTAHAGVKLTAYEVKSKDAHAWVEVYFPGAGWVPFDPTPGYGGEGTAGSAAAGGEGAAGAFASAAARPIGQRAQALAVAAAEQAATALAQGADALARAALGAAEAAAGATPAAKGAAGAAALALAAVLCAAAQHRRLRLRLALRRYSAASRGGTPDRGSAGVQKQFAAVSAAIWPQLDRCVAKRQPQQTARQYAAAQAALLPTSQAEALQRFVTWDDAARYGQRRAWQAPLPEELSAAAALLCARRHSARRT
ncbi:transglutaminase-like domain-containing protein [Paenibacillus sp. FSL H8-0537]|uniref:transglutaminase-like domain-containing protein n=1 Tax=Paenibacillus sp. FSL H8-0537 TaxID=2921399 RepID=UPI003100F01C